MIMSSAITHPGSRDAARNGHWCGLCTADAGCGAASLVLHHLTLTSRPPQSSGPRRWPVRRFDLEALSSADNPNDRAGRGRLEIDRAGSG
jgi:hypothetical protein